MNSSLNEEYDFREIEYNIAIGNGISPTRIRDIYRQIKNIKADAILITGLQLSCFHVILAALLAGVKKRIIVIHGSSLEAISIKGFKRIALACIEFFSLLMCTSFFGVSRYAANLSAAKFFKKKNRGHVYNIPSLKTPSRSMCREEFGISPSEIVVATSGRIVREKGFGYLVEAIKQVNNTNIKYLIIGDGEYLNEMRESLLEEISSKKVFFTGFVENVVDFVNLCDIFVLPTLHETLSVSLLEAASLAKPLISCKVGGVLEVVEDGVNGILVPPADALALASAIELMSKDDYLRQSMGNKSLERVNTVFSTTKILDRLRNIFEIELGR